jgi:Holliday junction resolvase RusA-like endonuclease
MQPALDTDSNTSISSAFTFFVHGVPVPQGSKSVSRSGHLYDVNAKTLKPWRQQIADTIRATDARGVIEGPVALSVVFSFPRPKSHYNKSGLTTKAPRMHQSKPDLDKLVRALGDGIATDANLLKDDSQIVSINAEKRYCVKEEQPGALVTIMLL